MTARLNVDWDEYYAQFAAEHQADVYDEGGTPFRVSDPVEYRGKRLFPDGWRYDMKNRGSEYPPPEDRRQLVHLLYAYWRRRQILAHTELRAEECRLDNLQKAQRTRSLPLKQSYLEPTVDEEGNRSFIKQTSDLEMDAIAGRVEWLRKQYEVCSLASQNLEEEWRELNDQEQR